MNTVRLLRADSSLRPAAAALWQNVFGDDPDMIEAFMDAAPFEKTCFAAVSGDTLAGMLFSLPAVLTVGGEAHESRYLYAVATDPLFRGKGIMSALEAFACEEAKREGAEYAALVPAEKPLFAMYQKLGYRTAFFAHTMHLPKHLAPQASLSPCTLPAFWVYRRALLAERSVSFELYPSMCAFRYADFIKSGTITLAHTPFGSGYLAYEKEGELLLIHESSLSGEALIHAASAVCMDQNCRKITVKGKTGTAIPFGMIKPLFEEKTRNLPVKIDGYMGLMLN